MTFVRITLVTALAGVPSCHAVAEGDASPVVDSPEELTIVSLEKRVGDIDPLFADGCAAWNITEEDARHFFARATPVGGGEYNRYDWFPCFYRGILKMGGDTRRYQINIGATGTLSAPREGATVWLICYDGCESYIPGGPIK